MGDFWNRWFVQEVWVGRWMTILYDTPMPFKSTSDKTSDIRVENAIMSRLIFAWPIYDGLLAGLVVRPIYLNWQTDQRILLSLDEGIGIGIDLGLYYEPWK